jgi:rRNA maturation endonuclease Nob1
MEQIMIKELTQEQKKEYKEIKSYFKYFYDCPACHRVFGSDDLLKRINFCPICQTAKKKKTYSLRKQLTKS